MPLGSPWTITVEELRTLTEKSLIVEGLTREQALRQTLYEPRGRNTAPAIAFLCRALQLQGFRESIVGVFPADQLIEDENAFRDTVLKAIEFAVRGDIVTLGITPTFPATGYGYIETRGPAAATAGANSEVTKLGTTSVAMNAIRFREKPDEKTAKQFLAQGGYLWNAGMFVFKLSRMIELLKQHAPKVWTPFETLRADYSNLVEVYDAVEAISIDYAVMEKLESHVTVPCQFGWNDVGSWDAVADVKEGKHSVLANSALVNGIDAEGATAAIQILSDNNFVFPTDNKTYAFVGVEDLVVVDTQDATLIVKRGQSEKVKDVVDRLKSFPPRAARRATQHAFEIRPWGKFEVLKDTPDFKSKVITVDPGAQISYQSHSKRAEHWTIIKGRGEVVLNDETLPVEAGSHVFIPLKAKHRIRNTGDEPLTFVEVQLGTYFGEDDIVRFEDSYGRK